METILQESQALASLLTMNRTVTAERLSTTHPLSKLVGSVFKKDLVSQKQTQVKPFFWDERRYDLDRVELYAGLSSEKKTALLQYLTRHTLSEAFAVEATAMNYAAKMILLGSCQEEKLLYSAIAYDEAMHLKEIENFLDFDPAPFLAKNAFIQILNSILRDGSKATCMSIFQVLLEGYGLVFYSQLRDLCLDADFKLVLQRIVKDEAVHHGSGNPLLSSLEATDQDRAMIENYLSATLAIFQYWPMPLLTAFESVCGPLDNQTKAQVLVQMDYQSKTKEKFGYIRKLLAGSFVEQVLGASWLEERANIPTTLEVASYHSTAINL